MLQSIRISLQVLGSLNFLIIGCLQIKMFMQEKQESDLQALKKS